MRQDVEALEGSRDQLAFLVLRLIAEHSPCAETYLLSRVAGGGSDDGANASAAHAQGLICDALRTLKSLGFIEFIQEQIAITDDGERFLDGSLAPKRTSFDLSRCRAASLACSMRAACAQRLRGRPCQRAQGCGVGLAICKPSHRRHCASMAAQGCAEARPWSNKAQQFAGQTRQSMRRGGKTRNGRSR